MQPANLDDCRVSVPLATTGSAPLQLELWQQRLRWTLARLQAEAPTVSAVARTSAGNNGPPQGAWVFFLLSMRQFMPANFDIKIPRSWRQLSWACQWATVACTHKPGYLLHILLCWFTLSDDLDCPHRTSIEIYSNTNAGWKLKESKTLCIFLYMNKNHSKSNQITFIVLWVWT